MFEVDELDVMFEEDEAVDLPEMEGASSGDVLVAYLNRPGRNRSEWVDLVTMSKASGKTCEQLVQDLRGSAIFQDPAVFEHEESWSIGKGWLLRAQYCCGYIPQKLEIARRMNERFPGCFDCNVMVLEQMLPASLTMDRIYISPGATWVPPEMYAAFLKDLLQLKRAPEVLFGEQSHTWHIASTPEADRSILNTDTYGVPREQHSYMRDRPKPYLTALQLFELTMNAKTAKANDYVWTRRNTYEAVLNKEATLVAQEKQNAQIRAFNRWVWEHKEWCVKAEERYNDTFVGFGFSPYDGSFLTFPGLNPNVTFYQHQRDAIARMLLSPGNVLLAHDVGTGKTYEMCAGVHEMYRMGISRKNLVVVPNNVLKATVDAHKYLYPDDKILAVFPKDFKPQNRQAVLEQVRDGDFVAVYMAYSSFDMIVMSKEYWIDEMTRRLQELRQALLRAVNHSEKRLLEHQHETLHKKLSTYVVEGADTPWLTFDRLGIETLVVDEAHNYKNIPLYTKTDNIVGMHATGSKKCKEMLEKTRAVNKLVMATGTPLTNSLADLFVLQTYLQPEELKFRGIDAFDMWINTFGERETNFEVDVDSTHLRVMTRFSTFHNLTELMALFSMVCDFHHMGEDEAELPQFDGYNDVCVPKNTAQAEYIQQLCERTERIRNRQVKRTEDNLLKVTSDAHKCALDERMVDEKYCWVSREENKVSVCARKVLDFYQRFPGTSQIVFSDLGTPKPGFNIYDTLKEELVALGIPDHQIAFVHDATSETARTRLFAAINAGDVRVVIGSTAKLGVGVNVQERLVALHHLSVPWRPSDMVQREGRGLRPGNRCKKLYICRYITVGSFDAYSWQLLENKQRFISSFLSGTSATRDADDVAGLVLNYAEIKALAVGNPLIKQRLETANRLEHAKISCRQRQKQLIALRAVVDNVPIDVARMTRLREITLQDAVRYEQNKEVVSHDRRVSFGEELLQALAVNAQQSEERVFAYQGFDVCLPMCVDPESPQVYIRSGNGGVYSVSMDTDKPLGCAMRIDHRLERLAEDARWLEEQIYHAEKQRAEAMMDMDRGNEYQDAVEALERELAAIDRRLAEGEEKSA